MLYLPPWVSPWSKLEVALLVVEREPGDVDLAGGLEEAGGDVEAVAVAAHNNIRLVSPIKLLVSAVQIVQIRLLRFKGEQNYMDTVWFSQVVSAKSYIL